MIVLGLDQAPRHIGFAYADDALWAMPVWGCRENPDYGENGTALMMNVHAWLAQFVKSIGAERIYFEQIVVNPDAINMPVLHAQFCVAKAIEFVCGELAIDCFEVDIAAWRKRFLGRGNAPKGTSDRTGWLKAAAIAAAARRGWVTTDHHAAEALGILDYGFAHGRS